MSTKKICFIICTNNETLLSECLVYINRLIVPENVEISLLTIENATSMTSGYNEGMHASDADINVYMHQDVFIINRNFLQDILDIFASDEKIGMMGMVGYPHIHESGMMWKEKREGITKMFGVNGAYSDVDYQAYRYSMADGITDVQVADGLMLVTSKNLEWDENFDAWDFYDATQCMRFLNAGYRVVVPNQRVPWVIHDDGRYLTVWDYNKYRVKFLKEYLNKTP